METLITIQWWIQNNEAEIFEKTKKTIENNDDIVVVVSSSYMGVLKSVLFLSIYDLLNYHFLVIGYWRQYRWRKTRWVLYSVYVLLHSYLAALHAAFQMRSIYLYICLYLYMGIGNVVIFLRSHKFLSFIICLVNI